MISPNGGESWLGGTTQTITWTYINVDNIAIEFSKDNGLTWSQLVSSIPASALSYSWTVPAIGSNLCKMRIKSLTQNSQDESNSTFTIPEPTVTLAYPIGGESFGAGTGQYIEWSTVGVTTVMVQYSTDNATTWNDIGSFPAGNNYCNWVAPTTSSTQIKIRVYNIESPINQATSPTSFSITTQPTAAAEKYYGGSNDGYKMASSLSNTLAVLAPNGGESYYPNNTVNISWSFRNIDTVKIEYSVNNGSTWNVIAASVVADLQTYPWTIPNSPSTQCLIKVSDLGSVLSDVSNATFTINSASVTLTYPNGGESFGEGTGQYIEWNSTSVATVLLEYSIDNGATWSSIGTAAATNNYANWVAPVGVNSQCLIRVSDSSTPSVSDTSNATFTTTTVPIADVAKYHGGTNDGYSMVNNLQPNITITSPNGGESWAAYSSHTITWSYTNVDNVSIEFSIDNGTSWTTLVASIPASQLSYSWTVPGTPSNYCSFRIKDIASSVSDINDAVFVIPNDLWVQIKYPNGGENFGVGTGQYIEWDYNNIQSLKLEYSTDNGANWLVIGTVNAANKYANWVIPSDISNQIVLRASDVNNTIFNDVSDLVFSTYAIPNTASEKYFGGSNDGYSMFSYVLSNFTAINIKLFIQGYYTLNQQMAPVRKNAGLISSNDEVDNIIVSLYSTPDLNQAVATTTVVLATNGTATAEFDTTLLTESHYYLAIQHKNTIKTWSATPVAITNGTTYDFTTAASQAYGNNQIEVAPGIYAIYSGDMNQDGTINEADLPIFTTANTTAAHGYIVSDLNGDGSGDLLDYPIYKNNADIFVIEKRPVVVASLPNITIGTQVWQSSNLDVATYRDGTPIPQVTDPTAWANLTTGAWCYYNNDPANGAIYGKLYNWYAVAGIYNEASRNNPNLRKKLAPLGWHVPSDSEWTVLTDYLGGQDVAGTKLKSIDTSLWINNSSATNEYGFTAIPGGYRDDYQTFENIGYHGYWWSATDENILAAWYRVLYSYLPDVARDNNYTTFGFSVRCLRD
jgi:uncharacterized protein (TIGR02145 family)